MRKERMFDRLYFETIDGSYTTDYSIKSAHFLLEGTDIKSFMDVFELVLQRNSVYRRWENNPENQELERELDALDDKIKYELKDLIDFALSLKGIIKYEPHPDWRLPLMHGHLKMAEQVYADVNNCTLIEAKYAVELYIKDQIMEERSERA